MLAGCQFRGVHHGCFGVGAVKAVDACNGRGRAQPAARGAVLRCAVSASSDAAPAAGQELLDRKQLETDYMQLVGKTESADVKEVLLRYKANLVDSKITSEEALQALTRQDLLECGVALSDTAVIKSAFPRLLPPDDDGRVYKNVTVHVPNRGGWAYNRVHLEHATRQQLCDMWRAMGHVFVVPIDSKPAGPLTVKTADPTECTDMSSVELVDGIHLAVVKHELFTLSPWLPCAWMETADLYKDLERAKAAQALTALDKPVREAHSAADAWALAQIKGEPGATVLRIKDLAKSVVLEGAAFSDVSAIVAERMQALRLADVQAFAKKLAALKLLIELGARGTAPLQGKQLRPFLIARSWEGGSDEQAAMQQLMQQHNIQAVISDWV